ncbi:acyloxyacyl hydrolase isoform 2-T2 [Anomaloglossus baeobatrachus]|uniref:acyloxyacyl hydrolase isoform X2 n=1 Tax=Anomaloglossus baeobatrachus TaxID=238106 RepID=UPI003F508EDC
MKGLSLVVSLFFLLMLMVFIQSSKSRTILYPEQAPINPVQVSGQKVSCIGCVLIVSMVEQLAQIHNSSAEKAMERLCSYMPEDRGIRGICSLIAELFGPDLITLLTHRLKADVICYAIKLCKSDPHEPICHLYEKPVMGLKRTIKQAEKIVRKSNYTNYETLSGVLVKICSFPLFRTICNTIDSSVPAEDFDKDNFSAFPSLRGYHWRGKDCNDMNKSIYPGRMPKDWDSLQDSNCNGIWGFGPEDGIPYEKKFCDGTDSKGIIILGDSAAAHFHIPPEWLTPMTMSKNSFSNMALAISNELDWPQFSMYTGFQNSTIGGWTQSLYLRLRNWNRCNHRDYQNIARNGGSSNNLQSYLISMARNKRLDKPAIVFYAMIGNDVCNPSIDTLKRMTTPKEMRINILKELKYLDMNLPKESHVILVSLADGRFLWNTLHDRYHPLGELNKDVTYEQFYGFLSCVKSNPCEGWMNKNETLRNLTTERAEQLSSVLQDITTTEKFNNFQLSYFENLYQKVSAKWETLGGKPWDLLEPVDGFHPNQIASAIGADLIWEEILQKRPEIFGKQNPFNQDIIKKFGDQGGH